MHEWFFLERQFAACAGQKFRLKRLDTQTRLRPFRACGVDEVLKAIS
jgi:hypothetical protein